MTVSIVPINARVSAPEIQGLHGVRDLRETAERILRAIVALRSNPTPRRLARLRSLARAGLDALRLIRRGSLPVPHRIVADLRSELQCVVDAGAASDLDLDDLEMVVEVGATRVLGDLAEAIGLPEEGGSISVGRFRPTGGDYRVDDRRCWIWQRAVGCVRGEPRVGNRPRSGRGEFDAGRIYFALVYGEIPKHHDVVRDCGERLCVNPAHGRLRHRGQRAKDNTMKLSFDDVRAIRNAKAQGAGRTYLAARYGVSPWTIDDIISAKRWPDPDYVRGCPLEGGSIVARESQTFASIVGDYRIDRETGCWVWLQVLIAGARPVIKAGVDRERPAALVYYESATGETIPAMARVGRLCGNALCVHPHHGVVVPRGQHTMSRDATARGWHFRRAQAGVVKQARCTTASATATRGAMWLARSIDAPLGNGPNPGTLADIVSAKDGDPFEAIRAAELHALVGDLDEHAADALPEEVRGALIEQLVARDFAPSIRSVPT